MVIYLSLSRMTGPRFLSAGMTTCVDDFSRVSRRCLWFGSRFTVERRCLSLGKNAALILRKKRDDIAFSSPAMSSESGSQSDLTKRVLGVHSLPAVGAIPEKKDLVYRSFLNRASIVAS